MRPLDESRKVGHHEALLLAHANQSQMRLERRERVVRDLGPRRSHPREQLRLPDVAEAHDAHGGDEPKLEEKLPLLPLSTRLRLPRGLPRRGREPRVPAPALPAFGGDEPGSRLHEIHEEIPARLVIHQRARGDRDRNVLARTAALLVARPVRARLRLEPRAKPETEPPT